MDEDRNDILEERGDGGNEAMVARGHAWYTFPTVAAMGRGVGNSFAKQRAARRVIASAELPADVAKLIDRVVKKTQLWSRERVEVARELIAHFEDGMEAGRTAQEMIANFGKVRTAAKLLRRAAKRNRALPWRVNQAFWRCVRWAFAGLGFIYIALTVRLFLGRPVVSHDYLADLTKEAREVPEGERAWPVYREAILKLKPVMDLERGLVKGVPVGGETSAVEQVGMAEVDRMLAEHQGDLALARKAAGMKGLGYEVSDSIHAEDRVLWPDYGKGFWSDGFEEVAKGSLFTILLPYLGDMRILAMTLRLDAERAMAHGEGERLLADMEAMRGIARHIRETPVMIGDLVSMAVMTASMQIEGQALREHAELFTDEELQSEAHRIAAWDDAMLRVRLESERTGYMDLIQRMYTDDGEGDGHMTVEGYAFFQYVQRMSQMVIESTPGSNGAVEGPSVLFQMAHSDAAYWAAAPAKSALFPSRREVVKEYEELLGTIIVNSSRPRWERSASVNSLIGSWMASPIEKIRHMPASIMFPAIENVFYQQDNSYMMRDATLTGIALELYQRRHGGWPAALDALVPELMPRVPEDRYNGKEMGYVVREGKVVLYSVGADGDDDGGKPGVDERGKEDRERARWDAKWDGDVILYGKDSN